MGAAVGLLKLPFTAAWSLVKLLFLPVLTVAAVGLVLGSGSVWFSAVVLVCGLWALALVRLWRIQFRGVVRSLAWGTVRVSGLGEGRRRARRGRRGGGRR
jgi:hypothetical protein